MTRLVALIAVALSLVGCPGSQPARPSGPTADKSADAPGETAGAPGEAAGAPGEAAGAPDKQGTNQDGAREFKDNRAGARGLERGVKGSAIRPTRTEAALKFTVVHKTKGPIEGIVIKLTNPNGLTFFTEETDAKGYAEVLVPVGQTYEVVYLSLGRKKLAARLPVADKPSLTMRLKLRYNRWEPPEMPLVLEGVQFDTGKATLRQESFSKLDRVVEYMTRKKSARIEISGHTDNVGNARRNKALSKRRAEACRKYLLSRGIAAGRVKAVGYGQELPIASNDSEEGRQKNRRIAAKEL